MPWRKLKDAEESAFSPQIVEELSSRHKLQKEDVEALGILLAHYLSPRFEPLGFIKEMEKEEAGAKKRAEVIKKTKEAAAKVMQVYELLRDLDTPSLGSAAFASPTFLNAGRKNMLLCYTDLHRLQHVMAKSEKTGERVRSKSGENKRRIKDEIRFGVVACLCNFWTGLGRKPTMTTDASRIGTPRSGPFVDFAIDVTMSLTDPPTAIHTDTLKVDIQDWHAFAKAVAKVMN